jgi:hypothetical protein
MSIITTWPAVPNRLLSIYASVYENPDGETREKLESFSTPASLVKRGGTDEEESSSSLFVSALQEARRLKIVEEVDGRIRIAAPTSENRKRKAGDVESVFRSEISAVLFNPELAREAEHKAFMFAIVWLLGKNPVEPLTFSEAPQDMVREDLGDQWSITELTNRSNYQNFLYWARYFGFATFVGFESERRVIPDPSRALLSSLPRIFGDLSSMDIEPFLKALNEAFPVFEGGEVWAEMAAMWTVPTDGENSVTIATSLALRRLADRGEIALESVADARSRILQFGDETLRVSRVRRGGVQ